MKWYEQFPALKKGEWLTSETIDHSDHDQVELTGELWQRKETLILLLDKDRAMVDADGRLALLQPQQIENTLGKTTNINRLLLYLGRVFKTEGIPDDGIEVVSANPENTAAQKAPVLAMMLNKDESEKFNIGKWLSLRQVAIQLNPLDAGLLIRAVALANWHRAHEFSPYSGKRTSQAKGGWVRVDETGREHFPRTDPAVIVAVTDPDDRLLLASNMAWKEKVFSLIAGFVDPGESLEQAVVREVMEEAGVIVQEPRYLGSQPWPFPASLMLGFSALTNNPATARPDGLEIRALRWFTRHELYDQVQSRQIQIPGKGSISRVIIEAWYGEGLPGLID